MRFRRGSVGLPVLALMILLAPGSLPALQQQNQSGNAGPVPLQMQLQVTPAPSGLVVTWRSVPGASRYVVHRWKRQGNQSRCCELHVPVGSALRWVDTSSLAPGTWVYKVVAHLPGGARGFQERVHQVTEQSPVASGTPGAQAGASGDNRLRPTTVVGTLDQPRQPGQMSTAPASSDQSPSAPASPGTTPPSAAPIASMPDRSPRTHQPVQTTPAPAPVPPPAGTGGTAAAPASGRYLVTAVAMYAGSVTTDNIIHEDGVGDEVYAAAFVRRYDRRTAAVLEAAPRQTTVYGDVHGRAGQRSQAGRLSPTGGIGNGDPIPLDAPVVRTVAAQERRFPWKLWEGTLTEGADALVITTSVWEYDGRPVLFDMWTSNQIALTQTLFFSRRIHDLIESRGFTAIELGATEASLPAWQNKNIPVMISVAFGLPPVPNLEGQDRPIGWVNGPALPNTTIVLTREIIEAALARPPLGAMVPYQGVVIPLPKPGMLVVNFNDRYVPAMLDRKAHYTMVIQVERLP